MHLISTEQDREQQLMRLAAQRQLYSTAKRIFSAQLILSGPIAAASALLSVMLPDLKGYIALWGILVVASDLFWLTPWQKRLRESGAKIQEAFDCHVLGLPWNDLKAGNLPDPELVKEHCIKYQAWASSMPPLNKWYAPEVDDLPIHIGRIACQRSNCWWDSKQRRQYAQWIIGGVGLAFIVFLLLSLGYKLTLDDFLLKVMAPLSPAFLLGFRQFSEHMEAAARLDKLKVHAEELWESALSGTPEISITARSRNLQDEIFENRKRSPFVFDGVFKRLHTGYEIQMSHGISELVAEAKLKLK